MSVLPQRDRLAGVTLIELLVVMIIVGLHAMIGVPSYLQYTMRTQRTEAKAALLRLGANQERFYLQNNRYSLDPEALGFPGKVSENGVYDLTIATVAGVTQDFVATAKPRPGGGSNGIDQTKDADCATFTLDSQGVRTAAPDPSGRCW